MKLRKLNINLRLKNGRKRLKKGNDGGEGNQEPPKFELPAGYKEKLDRLESLNCKKTKSVRNQIYDTAKSKVREDLHESFRNYLGKQNIAIDADVNAEAERLLKDYQDIFRALLVILHHYLRTERKQQWKTTLLP